MRDLNGPIANRAHTRDDRCFGSGETLVYVVSEDWYFLSHRLPMACAARDCGFHVVVATRLNEGTETIRAEGFEPVGIPMDRANTSPVGEARAIAALYALFRRVRPAIVHNVAIKPILDGGIAGRMQPGVAMINAFTGMGSLVGSDNRGSLLRKGVLAGLRWVGASRRCTALVQNRDDRDFLLANRLARPEQVKLIAGSGIDTVGFHPAVQPLRDEPIVVLMVARLLRDKGVGELIAAARELRRRGVVVDVRIAGDRDPANPNSLSETALATAAAEGAVTFLGRRSDTADLWRQAHIAVLPSYREGLPKSLLEAAASGIPIVTTAVAGCRDLVPDQRTGLLVPPKDPIALADAIQRLAGDPGMRRVMGLEARRLAKEEFSNQVVSRRIVDLYADVLHSRG